MLVLIETIQQFEEKVSRYKFTHNFLIESENIQISSNPCMEYVRDYIKDSKSLLF